AFGAEIGERTARKQRQNSLKNDSHGPRQISTTLKKTGNNNGQECQRECDQEARGDRPEWGSALGSDAIEPPPPTRFIGQCRRTPLLERRRRKGIHERDCPSA